RPGAAFTLRIDNGGSHGQYGRVSSAIIKLNGAIVVGPSDFNPQVAVITRRVVLQARNVVTVELRRAPRHRPPRWQPLDRCRWRRPHLPVALHEPAGRQRGYAVRPGRRRPDVR